MPPNLASWRCELWHMACWGSGKQIKMGLIKSFGFRQRTTFLLDYQIQITWYQHGLWILCWQANRQYTLDEASAALYSMLYEYWCSHCTHIKHSMYLSLLTVCKYCNVITTEQQRMSKPNCSPHCVHTFGQGWSHSTFKAARLYSSVSRSRSS